MRAAVVFASGWVEFYLFTPATVCFLFFFAFAHIPNKKDTSQPALLSSFTFSSCIFFLHAPNLLFLMYIRRSLPLPAAKRSVGALRHDMSPRLFSALLFLLLMCCACGPVRGQQVGEQRGVDLFVPGVTKITSTTGDKTFKSFKTPSLVEAGGMIVVLAEASHSLALDSPIDIVGGHAELKGDDVVRATNRWTNQIVATNQNDTIKTHR